MVIETVSWWSNFNFSGMYTIDPALTSFITEWNLSNWEAMEVNLKCPFTWRLGWRILMTKRMTEKWSKKLYNHAYFN